MFLTQGGVTNDLVEDLRRLLSGTATDFDVGSSTNDDSSISTAATQKDKAVDLVDRNTWARAAAEEKAAAAAEARAAAAAHPADRAYV